MTGIDFTVFLEEQQDQLLNMHEGNIRHFGLINANVGLTKLVLESQSKRIDELQQSINILRGIVRENSLHDESEERALENDCFVITEEHLKYLDVLYNANVMGIGALQNQFEIDKDTARDVLKLWVNTFEKRHKREV